MIKNSKRKIIENNEIRLHYLSGALNMLERLNLSILKEYAIKTRNETIDAVCKKFNVKLKNKDIKTLRQGSFRPENDEEYLIYEYYIMQDNLWNNKDFDYNLLDIKSYDYNEIIEIKNNYYKIFSKKNKNKFESNKINQICELAKKKYKENDNTKNISDLCDYIIKLEKVFNDNDLINILIKKQMFYMGFTIGRYICLENVKIFENKYNYTASEIKNNIINIYISNYEKLFSFIDFQEEKDNYKKEPKAEKKINKLLKNNKNTYFSKQDIIDQTSLSEITIKRYLIKQQKNKKIKKIGAKKNSKYIFIGG